MELAGSHHANVEDHFRDTFNVDFHDVDRDEWQSKDNSEHRIMRSNRFVRSVFPLHEFVPNSC